MATYIYGRDMNKDFFNNRLKRLAYITLILADIAVIGLAIYLTYWVGYRGK